YSYMPDVVGRVGYGAAWGDIRLTGAYDHDRNGVLAGNDSAFAGSLGVNINMPSMPGSALKVIGYYNSADSNYGPGGPLKGLVGVGVTGGQPEWSVLASFLYQATPNLGLIVSGQYFSDVYNAGTSDKIPDSTAWAAEVSAVWNPVKNFEVRPEVVYTKAKGLDGTVSGYL